MKCEGALETANAILEKSAEVSSATSFTVHLFHFHQFYTHTIRKCSVTPVSTVNDYEAVSHRSTPPVATTFVFAITPIPGLGNAKRPVKGATGFTVLGGKTGTTFSGK
jgi:hypothetical protein